MLSLFMSVGFWYIPSEQTRRLMESWGAQGPIPHRACKILVKICQEVVKKNRGGKKKKKKAWGGLTPSLPPLEGM
jgi:hypothetical protein